MNRQWFQLTFRICITASLIGIFLASHVQIMALAQAVSTATSGGNQPYITNTYLTEPSINVRAGPSTAYYEIIGTLAQGATATALGVSPGHDWIEIAYPAGPGGVGWVYAANVTLSPGFLQVIEPPPTATPLATATLDPTFVAQFNIQPTPTRLPTFTPPAPLVIPTFPPMAGSSFHFPMGILILAVGLIGMLFLLVSFFTRR